MAILLPALAAFAGGMLTAYINYLITRAFFINGKTGFALAPRSLITALFMACLFLIGAKTELNKYSLLIGGALGCTVGTLLFTFLLLRADRKDETGEEASDDGRTE